jgi:hypothetical protein
MRQEVIPDTTPTCRHDFHPDGGKEVKNKLKTTSELALWLCFTIRKADSLWQKY